MKLITQPDEGITPLLASVKRAKRRIAIVIFRFDLDELEDALAAGEDVASRWWRSSPTPTGRRGEPPASSNSGC